MRSLIEAFLATFVRPFFSLQVETLESFVEEVQNSGCTEVLLTPTASTLIDTGSTELGILPDFRMGVRYSVATSSGRRIEYGVHTNIIIGSEGPEKMNIAYHRREREILRMAKELRPLVPGVQVNIAL